MTASGVNLGTLVPKSQGWEQNAVRLRGSLGFLIDWLAITRTIRGFQVHRGIREEFNTLQWEGCAFGVSRADQTDRCPRSGFDSKLLNCVLVQATWADEMRLPRRVPWASQSELEQLCSWIYSDETDLHSKQLAVNKVSCLLFHPSFQVPYQTKYLTYAPEYSYLRGSQ